MQRIFWVTKQLSFFQEGFFCCMKLFNMRQLLGCLDPTDFSVLHYCARYFGFPLLFTWQRNSSSCRNAVFCSKYYITECIQETCNTVCSVPSSEPHPPPKKIEVLSYRFAHFGPRTASCNERKAFLHNGATVIEHHSIVAYKSRGIQNPISYKLKCQFVGC